MYKADSREEHLRALQDELADYMPADGNVEELLDVAAAGLAELDSDIENVSDALFIPSANSKDALENHGELVGAYKDSSESLEAYRARVLANFRQLVIAGSPEDIINFVAELLDIERSVITIANIDDTARFRIDIPGQALSDSPNSKGQITELIQKVTAASYGIDVRQRGTLEYITESEYNNSNYDTSTGYATLDNNGDVTSGGTYGSNI